MAGKKGTGTERQAPRPSVDGDYTADQIQVLKGLEAVRKRPGMYIGSTSARGLHHLVYEVVDNAIDEAMAGHCSKIDVAVQSDDSVTVEDDGRGIPVDLHPTEQIPGVELAMTTLHAGGKFDKRSYKVSGGLHGVGVSVVNALSAYLEVEVCRGGKRYHQRYERGVKGTDLRELGKASGTGTRVTFKPDHEIFTELTYSFDTLSNRLRELAFLNKGLAIRLRDERDAEPVEESYRYEGGLAEYVTFLRGESEGRPREDHLLRGGERGGRARGGDAVQRRLRREHPHLRQQHQHPRGGHAPHRLQGRPHADHQRLCAP